MTTLPSRPPLYRFYCWSDSDFAFEWILPLILWCREANLLQPIRGTTQIWAVIRHQYTLHPFFRRQFAGKSVGRRLFSKALLFREGPGGPAPLIFRPKWGPKGGKKFFWRPPPPHLYQGLDDRPTPAPPPPPPLSEGLDSPLIVVFIFLWIPAGNNHEHHRSLWSCHYSSWHILSTRYNKSDVFLS